MNGYIKNIEQATKENTRFRTVLYTSHHLQLVLMTIKPGEDIGMEVHNEHDQFFRIEQGTGKVVINGVEHELSCGIAVIVPAGSLHNVVNTSSEEDLHFYTIYGPPHHKEGTIHTSKEDALERDEEFDGVTSE